MMEHWDTDRISETFRSIAIKAERDYSEVRRKVKLNPSYKMIYDEHLAKFYVYNYLHGKLFLSSREQLVEELQRMLSYEVIPSPECYDLDRFERYRQACINGEISKFRNT